MLHLHQLILSIINTAKDTVYINVLKTFLPDPKRYGFPNYVLKNPLTWEQFKAIYPEVTEQNHDTASWFHKSFYDHFFGTGGANCFWMDATSLLTYNNGVNDEFTAVSANILLGYGFSSSQVPSNWLKFPQAFSTVYPTLGTPANVLSWNAFYQPLQFDAASMQDRINYQGTSTILTKISSDLSASKYDLVLLLIGPGYAHALIPYRIDQDTPSNGYTSIAVYDCNYPGDSNCQLIINGNGQILNYQGNPVDALLLTSKTAIKTSPQLPDSYTYQIMLNSLNYLSSVAHLCYTDASSNKLGYDNGVFKNEIPGTCPMIPANDSGNNNNSTEEYYVPDPSIKMELFGTGSGTSQIGMGNLNGLIIANVTVSPSSVDEFKILNNGTGIYFNSETDTTQSLGLMLDVETPNNAQIVNANLSQIEKGGYINLSNNNGTITLQNSGLPRTCNMFIENATNGQNSSINLTNIVIEGNSTLYINPSNWNDIDNSTVTINDVGSNGQTYYTEIITYKDGQVTQGIFPSAALTIAKSAYQ